ncbi:MAG: hypothetical protein A2162_02260 [Deltaproteobacteria bacterium RBG_13_52_11b]|nr:MAG: hypothetical protein A2162_02260 [Deltaproteobacteria bacterium RBG_13_52_11b]
MTISGILMGVLSTLLLRTRRSAWRTPPRKDSAAHDYAGAFLVIWNEIEVTLRNIASRSLGESAALAPLSKIVEVLTHKQVLATSDQKRLLWLLEVRNEIVHGRKDHVSNSQILSVLREAEFQLKRLSNISMK